MNHDGFYETFFLKKVLDVYIYEDLLKDFGLFYLFGDCFRGDLLVIFDLDEIV